MHSSPSQPRVWRVGVLGTGRVANQLVPALARAGHHVVAVWGRSLAAAQTVAAAVPAAVACSGPAALPPADVYLIAVADAAVAAVARTVQFPASCVVAHTSGSVPLAALAGLPAVQVGVWYPLQTFSAGRAVEWAQVPICVEATEPAAEALLLALARTLSPIRAQLVATPQRQALHVAAVFACNFPYHLLGISQTLLGEAGLPWHLLEPLIQETMAKALASAPFAGQTGPAVRHDAPTLAAHQELLEQHPQWQALYQQLSTSIQDQHPLPKGQL